MLFTIEKILVCTDLSPKSDDLLRSAEQVRRRVNAEMDVLYVSDIGLHIHASAVTAKKETYYDAFVASIGKDLANKLEAQITRTETKGRAIFAEGHVADKICDIIVNGEKKYDLLIIGHNSREGMFHHFLGSVARKIVSSAPLPTIVVRRPMGFNTIAAFIDGTKPIDWMISSAMDFYRSLKFNKVEFISLWHDLPEPFHKEGAAEEFKENVEEEVKYIARENENYLVRVEPTKELIVAHHLAKIVQEDNIDLAVMRRHHQKRINKAVLGSETLRMLETNTTNILIMPV